MKTPHLNEEQFERLLAGEDPGAEAAAHLHTCPECRRELETVGSAVGDLREISLAWAEQEGSRIPVPSRWALQWNAAPRWSLAAAAMLLIVIGAGVHRHDVRARTAAARINIHSMPPAPTQDSLAEDNQLLQAINEELQQQTRPQVPVSELGESSRPDRRSAPRELVN